MQTTKASLLLHPAFMCSLAVLLLNDHYWKYEYHNWLTGKLSDFAGVIVLPVFLMALLPKHQRLHLLFTALFFAWWKSPLSEPMILFARQTASIPLYRVVDPTDLLALLMLPLARWVKPVRYNYSSFAQACFRIMAGMLAFVSLCSTSIAYRYGLRYGDRENRISFYEDFKTDKTKEEIIANLRLKGITPSVDSIVYSPVINSGGLHYRITGPFDSTAQWKPVPQSQDSSIYLRRNVGTYYSIPAFVFDGDTLKNVEFTINNRPGKKKGSSVWIESFETARPGKYTLMKNKERKRLKQTFEALFLKP